MSAYATLAQVEAYTLRSMKARDIWHRYLDDQTPITIALNQATDIINSLNYIGYPAQADMAFPREGQAGVPDDVINACIEIALALLDGVDPEMEFESQFHTSEGMGGVRTTYDRTTIPTHVLLGVPSHRAMTLLTPYVATPEEIELSRV